MNTVTIEQLAEKLNGNLWIKGDLKRIYLEEGHNTKKMSTKTYVYQDHNGEFKVSCKVECPSQPWQWCKSQEDEVKESVYRDIENALSETVYIIVNKEGKPAKYNGEECSLYFCEHTYTEIKAKHEVENCSGYHSYITMPRHEFEKIYAKLEAEHIKASEDRKSNEVLKQKVEAKTLDKANQKKIDAQAAITYGVDIKVNHSRFGLGTVTQEDADKVWINFADHGEKFLLKKFATLTIASND